MMGVAGRRCLSLLLTLLTPATAWCQQQPLWELGLGAALGTFPSYRGASAQHAYLLPFPFITYRGEWVSVDHEGLRGKLFESPRWRLELSADAMVPVEQDAGLRDGMPDLASMLELGPSLEYLLQEGGGTEWRLRLPLRSAIAVDLPSIASQGAVFHPNLAVDTHHGRWQLGGSLGPLFASEGYHDYYYSVPVAYATPQRASYQADGGYSGMRLTMGASRYFGNVWLGMFVRYDDLNGAVFVDSPLVEQKSAVMGGMALSWVFHRSAKMVER
jgi:outer membrane protein